jgi:predicted lipid-binding transport protein (Tim44 family)/uncharacterized Zn finger protein (UPF0148 family)
MKKSTLWKVLICIVVLLFVAAGAALARAGGAGGGSSRSGSGGGGGDGLGGLVIYIFILLVQAIGVIPTLILIAIIVLVAFLVKRKKARQTVLKTLTKEQRPLDRVQGYGRFKQNNSDFSADEFFAKVKTAFISIQKAWSDQDLSKVRRYISDGVFQRFNTQFKMMSLLKQENPISDIMVNNISIDRFEVDGNYDIIHAAVTATMYDQFVCKTNPQLNSPGGRETFLEYWSFIRKRGMEHKDIYHTHECPKCSAPLSDNMGEIGKCAYCGAMVNSGEFDWVLSEITQADDYARQNLIQKAENLKKTTASLVSEYSDFAVQLVEDKASNGYLQIKTAEVMKDPAIMRRFVTDKAFEKIKNGIPDERIVYNRLFLNDMTLVAAQKEEKTNTLTFSVTISYQRVKLIDNDSASIIDPYIQTHTEFLQMERQAKDGGSKGSLYAHTCPSCGASIQDSLDINCAYCGNPLNNLANEWIIKDILTFEGYKNYISGAGRTLQNKVSSKIIDSLYDVKDYAFNNVMIMISADGIFAEEEKQMAGELARKWNYRIDRLEPLFDMARSGRLSIRMPEDTGKRKKIYDLMVKFAEADNRIAPEEKELLSFVREEYLEESS